MISRQTESAHSTHKLGQRKSCARSDGPKRRGVKPLDAFLSAGNNKHSVVMFDPPCSAQGGGHAGANCDLKRSASAMKFNDQRSAAPQRSLASALSTIAEGARHVTELLMLGGLLLVKCKGHRGPPCSSEVVRLAREAGVLSLWGTSIFTTPQGKVARKQLATPMRLHSTNCHQILLKLAALSSQKMARELRQTLTSKLWQQRARRESQLQIKAVQAALII